MPHLFMDGIEVEVPEGTLLIFNPTSKSPDALHGMKDVQFRAGGVIFQTKTDVLKEMDKPRFAQFPFLEPTDDVAPIQINYQIPADPKDEEAFKFYPMIFDFMRRKYDDKYAVLHSHQLTFDEMQLLKRACNVLLPGMYQPPHEWTDNPQKNADILASRELFRSEQYTEFVQQLHDYIRSDDADQFCALLLNRFNPLSIGATEFTPLEVTLLKTICDYPFTPARLRMLTALYDPNEFCGRFFLGTFGQATIFTRLVEYALSKDGPPRTAEARFIDFQKIVKCLVMDLGMPLNIMGGRYNNDDNGIIRPLLDLAKESRSWIAFLTFVEYFPELMHDQHNLVSGNFLRFTPPQSIDPDLPFLLVQLLPYITTDELDTAVQQQLDPTVIHNCQSPEDIQMHPTDELYVQYKIGKLIFNEIHRRNLLNNYRTDLSDEPLPMEDVDP